VFFPFFGQTKAYREPYVRWPLYWVVNLGFDALEALLVNRGDSTRGRQGDKLGLRIWYLRLWMTASYILGSALAFGVKANDPRTAVKTDPDVRDYLLGLVFPLVMIGTVVWWKSGFEGALLESVVGVKWPTTDTSLVDDLLLVDEKDKIRSIRDGAGAPRQVALFKADRLTAGEERDGQGAAVKNAYYPEADPTTNWDDRPAADEEARKNGHTLSDKSYTLKQLFDRSKIFAGLLSMALVNFDRADNAEKKAKARAIFNDWNLDFRSEDEWNDLMETTGNKTGLLQAAEQWMADLKASRASDGKVLERLNDAFGLTVAAPPIQPS
jgi:hypothetical protein